MIWRGGGKGMEGGGKQAMMNRAAQPSTSSAELGHANALATTLNRAGKGGGKTVATSVKRQSKLEGGGKGKAVARWAVNTK